MIRLEEIKEALDEWVLENKDRYPPDGPFGTTFYKRQSWLIRRVKKLEKALENYCDSEMNQYNPVYIEAQKALTEEDEK